MCITNYSFLWHCTYKCMFLPSILCSSTLLFYPSTFIIHACHYSSRYFYYIKCQSTILTLPPSTSRYNFYKSHSILLLNIYAFFLINYNSTYICHNLLNSSLPPIFISRSILHSSNCIPKETFRFSSLSFLFQFFIDFTNSWAKNLQNHSFNHLYFILLISSIPQLILIYLFSTF